ncbi:hypothetical protein BDR04DRAFT_1121107 [Suillus decipiens]|nr:hypothetical protein BDR04DRAFT_1121107 [Suillus decipiens]
MHIVEKVVKLRDGHPDCLKLAVDMGEEIPVAVLNGAGGIELELQTDNVLQEDIKAVPNFELVAIAPDKNLNALLPKQNLVNKTENNPTHSPWQKMVSDDTGATPSTALWPPATSVLLITILSLQDDPPASVQSPSFIEDPPIASVSTAPLQQMDVDNSGEGLMKVLEEMTLEPPS